MRTARAAWLLVALNAAPLAAEDLPSARRNFVACPIVRDTASVPCWLAEYDGELYFLTLQTDVSAPVTPPWLGHRVLVEGKAARDRPRISLDRAPMPAQPAQRDAIPRAPGRRVADRWE